MNTKQQSTIGDWLFMIGALALVGGYLAYENLTLINTWLATIQTAIPTTDAGTGAWLASNWGLVMLIGAMIVAGVKWALTQHQGAVGSDGVPVVTYRRCKFVNVKLVR